MSIFATDKGGSNIEPIESGTHIARCIQMIHIGTLTEEIQGKEVTRNLVRITWEFPTITQVFDESKGEEPRILSKEFTLSMNSKSGLRKFLDTWRGVPFTDEESKKFDVAKLIGVPCMLSVGQKKSQSSGNVYNTIDSAVAIPKGMNAPDQILESLEINYENLSEHWESVPQYVREKMIETPEYQNCGFEFPENDESDEPNNDAGEPTVDPMQTPPATSGKKEKLPF